MHDPVFVQIETMAQVQEYLAKMTDQGGVNFVSPPLACLTMGPAYYMAFITEIRKAYPDFNFCFFVDCGDQPGAVMAAIRAGLRQLIFSGAAEYTAKLSSMINQVQGELRTSYPAHRVLLAR